MSETVYLHTWGNRRHIAAGPIRPDGRGVGLCGQYGYTTEARFQRSGAQSARRRASILRRPVCANCLKESDPAPSPSTQGEDKP